MDQTIRIQKAPIKERSVGAFIFTSSQLILTGLGDYRDEDVLMVDQKNNESTISVCMIVRNEEQHMERCLRSISDVAYEIVVVDTGSTDRTAELAEDLGAKVFRYKWQDSFAAARNYGIKKARGDWIFVMDADEELPESEGIALKALVQEAEAEAYYILVQEAGTETSYASIRLFRRRDKYRYKGVIHESLVFPGVTDVGKFFGGVDIRLTHYGYQLSEHEMAVKHFRNLDLLQKAVEKDPGDPRANYYLGLSEDKSGRLEEAVKYYETAYKNDHTKENPYINRNLAITLEHLGRYKEAHQYVDDGIRNHPQYTDLHYLKGLLLLRKGDFEKAADNFARAIEIGPAIPIFPSYPETGGRFAKRELATCYVQLGRLREARDLYVNVLAEDPKDVFSLRPLARLLTSHHDRNKVKEELEKLVDMSDQNVRTAMREIFGE